MTICSRTFSCPPAPQAGRLRVKYTLNKALDAPAAHGPVQREIYDWCVFVLALLIAAKEAIFADFSILKKQNKRERPETPTDEPEQDTHKSFVAVKTHAFDKKISHQQTISVKENMTS